MAAYKIALLPGDGVGHDVMHAANLVLDAIKLDATYTYGDIGWEFWKNEGNPLPQRTIDLLKQSDCALLGAVTSKSEIEAQNELCASLQHKGIVYPTSVVSLRQLFNLHTNIRPCKAFPGNPLNVCDDIDLVVFRQNTEGLYAGVEFRPVPQHVFDALATHTKMARFMDTALEDLAISCRIFTREGCQTIVRQAFEYAKKYNKKSVTLVEKSNVIRQTSGLMVEEARKIAKQYPDIEFSEVNVDAMCMWLVKNPQDFDVLVTSNMFGDIISDLCAQLVGGLGFAGSANIGDTFAFFEPVHGSVPKYAGQYKVNPIGMIRSVVLMLQYLGLQQQAYALDQAIAKVILEGHVKTYDMGGTNTSLEVASEIAKKYKNF